MRYEYINLLLQFGYLQLDLLVFIDDIVIHRETKMFPESVTDDDMGNYAMSVVVILLSAQPVDPDTVPAE